MIRFKIRFPNIFNLGSGEGVSVKEAIEVFERISAQKLNFSIGPRRDGDVEAIFSDTTKSTNELKWTIKFNLEEMMNSAWKWENYLN